MKVSAALDEDKSLLSSNFSFRGSNSLFWHPQAFTGTRTHPHAEVHTPHTHTIINSEAVRHSGIRFQPHHSGDRGWQISVGSRSS